MFGWAEASLLTIALGLLICGITPHFRAYRPLFCGSSVLLLISGVFAIVLGLALQNTLADVFSGLAINMERPFQAGDWITVKDGVEGQVVSGQRE